MARREIKTQNKANLNQKNLARTASIRTRATLNTRQEESQHYFLETGSGFTRFAGSHERPVSQGPSASLTHAVPSRAFSVKRAGDGIKL